MEVYLVDVTVYSDTRMGAHNHSYKHPQPYSSLESAKTGIIEDLKNRLKHVYRIPDAQVPEFNIKLDKSGQWSKDFNPEIVTVTKVKVK